MAGSRSVSAASRTAKRAAHAIGFRSVQSPKGGTRGIADQRVRDGAESELELNADSNAPA